MKATLVKARRTLFDRKKLSDEDGSPLKSAVIVEARRLAAWKINKHGPLLLRLPAKLQLKTHCACELS